MKLSMSMWSVVAAVKDGRIDLSGFIEFAAEQGVAGVELLDFFWSDAEREIPKVKEQIAAADMEIAVYAASNNFVQPDADARRHEVSQLKRNVDIALELGVDTMRVFSGDAREGVAQDEGTAWILEGLSSSAAYAEARGVTLALENHGRFAGRSDQVRDIIEQVGSPALRVNFDTGNFLLVGQDPVAAARELAQYVVLVHLKDMRVAAADETGHRFELPDGTVLTGSAVGDGLVDLPAVMAVLREAGYDGWLSLEFEGSEEPLTVGVPRSLAAARALLA